MKKLFLMLIISIITFSSGESIDNIIGNLKNKLPMPIQSSDATNNSDGYNGAYDGVFGDNNAKNKKKTGNDTDGQERYSGEENNTLLQRIKKKYENAPIPDGAKIFKMASVIEIPILVDNYAVIDFPFIPEIGKKSSFKIRAVQEAQPKIQNQQRKVLNIERQQNKIFINSQKLGSLELLILNGAYPIVLKIYVNKNKGNQYNAIRDLKKQTGAKNLRTISKLEGTNHSRTVLAITYALKRNEPINGYSEQKSINQRFSLKNPKITMILLNRAVGDRYFGEKWAVINDSKKTIQLYNEMFYEDNKANPTYSVAIDNNVLEKGKATYIYIVKGR